MRTLPTIEFKNVAPRIALLITLIVVACVYPSKTFTATQPVPIEEFVPIDELPQEERLPAAPFLISAYSIVWILAFGYFWMLSRRLSGVERELADLTRRHDLAGNEASEETY